MENWPRSGMLCPDHLLPAWRGAGPHTGADIGGVQEHTEPHHTAMRRAVLCCSMLLPAPQPELRVGAPAPHGPPGNPSPTPAPAHTPRASPPRACLCPVPAAGTAHARACACTCTHVHMLYPSHVSRVCITAQQNSSLGHELLSVRAGTAGALAKCRPQPLVEARGGYRCLFPPVTLS